MDRRAYADVKMGRVYFIALGEGGSTLWGTHYRHPKTGVLCSLVNSELPWRSNEIGAQVDLDAYALQHELAAAVHPEEEGAFNTVGVCEHPEEIPIPFPKGAKVVGSVFLAPVAGRQWVSSLALDCNWGADLNGTSRLPARNGTRWPDRETAVDHELGMMFAYLKKLTLHTRNYETQRERALDFLDGYEWHDDAGARGDTQAADESAPAVDPLGVVAEVPEGPAEAEAAEDPATPAGCSRVEPDPEKMAALQNRLRSLAGELFAVKDRKRAVDADFAAQIKGVEASMQTCLDQMHDLEWPPKPEPARLPFETASPAPPETKPAAPPETKSGPEPADDSHLLPEPEAGAGDAPASSASEPQEPALIACPACFDGVTDDEEECRRCMGTGRIIPPAAPLAPCGHPVAATLDETGAPRPCVLCAQDARPKRSSRRSSRSAEVAL